MPQPTMKLPRTIIATLPAGLDDAHPQAVAGTAHDFKRANDKHYGGKMNHYAQKGQLFYVESEACKVPKQAKPQRSTKRR
jgi:hypothetical protein